MTKEAAQRSAMRRVALTKVADAYADIMYGYHNNWHPGIVQAGVGSAVNDNLTKTYGKNVPPPSANVSTAPGVAAAQRAVVGRAAGSASGRAPAVSSSPGFWHTGFGRTIGNGLTAMTDGIGRGIEWGASWPDHLKSWWNRTFPPAPPKVDWSRLPRGAFQNGRRRVPQKFAYKR